MIAVVELLEIDFPCSGKIGETQSGDEVEDDRLKQEEQEGKETPLPPAERTKTATRIGSDPLI